MIGDTLREARERQNLSIKDIEKGTSIRALYIESIEKGEFDKLPGNAYTKGFIRNYANFLKLDADACVRQYNEENNPEEVAAKEAAKRAEEAAEAEQQAAYEKREAEKSRSRSGIFGSSHRSESTKPERAAAPRQEAPRVSISDFESRVESSHHRQTLLMGIIAVLVIAAGAYFLFGSDDETASKQPQTKVTTQAKTTTTSSSSQQQQQQQAAAKPVEEKKQYTDVQVSAKFSERCWVSVKADGKTIFEGTIDEGTSKDWKAEKELKITAGNAGAVELTYNGENKGILGGEGEVVEKTYALSENANGTN
ncbi:MAG: helix-turn-helix domain-containing protein [Veillonellaceae bacterium]|nr:helix-turn-helix domain-containing protein [Veillonellaceae bacterium]